MTNEELKGYRKRLETMVAQLSDKREHLEEEVYGIVQVELGETTVEEPVTSDKLSHEYAEREVALAMLGNEEELLHECRAALERIKHRTFGTCIACGKRIAKKRLEAIPYARHCIKCARNAEAQTG
jgi:RNA polymerase-binding protein DksA